MMDIKLFFQARCCIEVIPTPNPKPMIPILEPEQLLPRVFEVNHQAQTEDFLDIAFW